MYKVSVEEFIKTYSLKILTEGVDISGKFLTHPEANRPALQLAGFFDFFDAEGLQVIGRVEYTYLQGLDSKTRRKALSDLFEKNIPCVVLCHGLSATEEMLEQAQRCGVPMLQTHETTTDFVGEAIRWLKVQLAPRLTLHGVLVDVCGEGVLIMGESGIGKSETALELVKRGHRLVADDSVEIKKVSSQTLIGSCPEITRYLIELRGVGVIDVRQMYGVQSVKAVYNVDIVVQLEPWDDKKPYDRLGLEDEYMEILGNKIVCCHIPIRPGSNLAIICEAAAINHRLKKMGYHAAKVLTERVSESFKKPKEQ